MSPVGSYGRHLRRLWVIPAAMLVTSACGSRMERTDIQAAERGGLAAAAASSQAAAASPVAGAASGSRVDFSENAH